MADLEKVLRGLECCTHMGRELYRGGCSRCPYEKDKPDCRMRRDLDTLEILREQEPVRMIAAHGELTCSRCGFKMNDEVIYFTGKMTYCPNCGLEVKWE